MSGQPLTRTCPSCKETKSLTNKNFKVLDESLGIIESYCTKCMEVINTRMEDIKNRD